MTSDVPARIAVFWDIENVHDDIPTHTAMTRRIRESGQIVKAFAFADWDTRRKMAENLHAMGYDLIHVPDSRDNAADYKMASYIMDHIIHYPETSRYVMITGDGDFKLIAGSLRDRGLELWVISNPITTASELSDIATEYTDIQSFRPMSMGCSRPEGCDVAPSSLVQFRRVAGIQVQEAISAVEKAGQKAGLGHVKHVMRSLNPDFSESALGFATWKEFVIWAEKEGFIRQDGDPPSVVLRKSERVSSERSETSTEMKAAYDLLTRIVERRANENESVSMSAVLNELVASKTSFERIGYTRLIDFILSAETRGLIRVIGLGSSIDDFQVLPYCDVDKVKAWFEKNVERLFGAAVRVPKPVFLEKISKMLLDNRSSLRNLEAYLVDEGTQTTYQRILEASKVPFLPPYQMSMAHVLLGRGTDISETVRLVNAELEALGITLQSPS